MLEWLLERRLGLVLAALAGYLLGRRQAPTLVCPDLSLRAGTELLQQRRRVLALGARPGELERTVGGTLWRLKQAGATIAVVVAVPSGGGRSNADEVLLRELEQAQAVLGYDRIDRLAPLTGPADVAAVVPVVAELWARESPDLVLAPVVGRDLNTPAARLAQAVFTVAQQRGEVGRLALYGSGAPNLLVDVSRALSQKWAGLRAYPSALTGLDASHHWQVERSGRGLARDLPSQAVEGLYRL